MYLLGVGCGLLAIGVATWSRLRGVLFNLKGVGVFVGIGLILLFMWLWKKYVAYRLAKLETKKVEYEAEKEANINQVLRELTPSMQIALREKLALEAQATIEKQGLTLRRLEQESKVYEAELQGHTASLAAITTFRWCDDCMRLGQTEAKQASESRQPEGKEAKDPKAAPQDPKKTAYFQCPNNCLAKYFQQFQQAYKLFQEQSVHTHPAPEPDSKQSAASS